MIKKIIFGILFPLQIFAQMEMWVARYDGPYSTGGFDHAYAMAIDDSGYIYVTGTSLALNNYPDYATVKYNDSGDTVWVRRYNGPNNSGDDAYAIAVDKNGNVYVTGRSGGNGTGYDYATVKYNSSGDTVWVRRYDSGGGTGDKLDEGKTLVLDDNSNVYVTGRSSVGDYTTIKYDSSGGTMWVRTYAGPICNNGVPNAIATDKDGNIYVTGRSVGIGTSSDIATIKYNTSGDTVWIRRYNGINNGVDEGNAIAVDKNGNVYVGGVISDTISCDLGVIKYNSSGNTMWVRRYNGAVKGYQNTYKNIPTMSREEDSKMLWNYAGVTALAIDTNGYIYVTGKSYSSYDGRTGINPDYATIKYNASGDTVWIRRYNGPGDSIDCATGIAVDDSGNVYVTGYSDGTGGGLYPEDYATIKYSSSGNEEWVQRYDGPANHVDCAYAIALDKKGYVYVTGSSHDIGTDDYLTIKYACVGVEETTQNSKFKITDT